MKKYAVLLVLLVALLAAIPALAHRPLHSVHVGGPDFCYPEQPGCDANFSLTAIEHADGTVTGQWTDQWGFGYGGIHVAIDCLVVEGNEAWLSGTITHGEIKDFFGEGLHWDLTGLPAGTRVVDNGNSANDPPDQISYSWIEDFAFECTEMPDADLFDAPQGQVIVK